MRTLPPEGVGLHARPSAGRFIAVQGGEQGNPRAHRLVLRLGLVALLCVLTLDIAAAQAAERPDLIVKNVTVPAGPVAPGDGFVGENKVKNKGDRRAPASPTGYFLSSDTAQDETDASAGTASVPRLGPGKSSTSSPDLDVPLKGVPDGNYHLIACADEPRDIREKQEGNNCRSSDTQIEVDTPTPPQVTGATADSATTVAVTFDRQLNATTVQANGAQFAIGGLTVSAADSNGNVVTLTTASQTPGTGYTVTVAGSVQGVNGLGVDPAHNSANFNGFTPPLQLKLNEVAPNITSSADLVELKTIAGGSVAGMTLQQDMSPATTLATLPAATVATGDPIVIHLNPPVDLISETTSPTQCVAASCYSGAWDFAGGTTGITFSSRVLTIRGADSVIHDGAAFISTSGTPPVAFPTHLQALQDAGHWLPANCSGLPCTPTSTPTAADISADWTGASSTSGANTIARASNADTNQKADWTVGSSTMGAVNAGQR